MHLVVERNFSIHQVCSVSIHLREWGAMHLTESNLRWAAAYRFNSSS